MEGESTGAVALCAGASSDAAGVPAGTAATSRRGAEGQGRGATVAAATDGIFFGTGAARGSGSSGLHCAPTQSPSNRTGGNPPRIAGRVGQGRGGSEGGHRHRHSSEGGSEGGRSPARATWVT